MARPAAEIEPSSRIFSSNWILPGPMRPSGSRSMPTLREGSEVALDFGMEELALPVPNVRWILSCFRSKRVRVLREQSAAKQKARAFHEQGRSLRYPIRQNFSTETFGAPRHELSIVVFTVAGRSLPSKSSHHDGALDADAGGAGEFRAAAAERAILCAARDTGRADHRGSLASDGDGPRQPGHAGHLFRAADQGMARGRRCRSCQGRIDFSPALARRARFAFLAPARRRAAGSTFGGADCGPDSNDRAGKSRTL